MSIALINPQGYIDTVALKMSTLRRLQPGERLLPYNPPAFDPLTHTLTVDQPVLDAVTFTLTALPGGTAKKLAADLAAVDIDVDAIYSLAIGNRGPEYTEAERQAQAYRDAGYTGTVPPYVSVWATASSNTATWAADDILTQATAWRNAATLIREKRLQAKAALRAGTPGAMLTWKVFVTAARQQLGLPA